MVLVIALLCLLKGYVKVLSHRSPLLNETPFLPSPLPSTANSKQQNKEAFPMAEESL